MYYNMIDIYETEPPKKPKKLKTYTMLDELAQVFHKVRLAHTRLFTFCSSRREKSPALFVLTATVRRAHW
jgi:hypothetical protein